MTQELGPATPPPSGVRRLPSADRARPPGRASRRPSPIFLALVAIFAVTAWALWAGRGRPNLLAFTLVTSGWVISLCLHEYGHALTAYHGGDRGVLAKGYLTLNPLRYSDLGLSVVLPVIFVLAGGIGLPGGAVWVDRGAVGGRLRRSLVSAAGPLANILIAAALLVPVAAFAARTAGVPHLAFWSALAYLGFLQVSASVLNLLPVPGLDGFGILEPWLPPSARRALTSFGGYGIFAVFLLLWVPVVNRTFFGVVFALLDAVGAPRELAANGDLLFRFWSGSLL